MSSEFELPTKPAKNKSVPQAAAEPQVETTEKTEVKAAAKPEYSKEELLRIFDEIIFSGEYIEEIMVRGRLPVKFSTRTAEQINQVQDALDASGYQLISSVENRRAIMNLEQALISYNGKDLSGMKQPERSKIIAQLPGPIIGTLFDELNKFDMKVAAACREETNF